MVPRCQKLLTCSRSTLASRTCWTASSGREAFLRRKLDRLSSSCRKCLSLKPEEQTETSGISQSASSRTPT